MLLPREELKGKKVLDICCRRGRGVYKLSSLVGDSGEVMGVDWSPSYVDCTLFPMERASSTTESVRGRSAKMVSKISSPPGFRTRPNSRIACS